MQEDLFAGLVCQPGFPVTKQELQEDLRTLIMTGLFANVDVRVVPLPPSPSEIKSKKGKKSKRSKRFRVTFVLTENLWQPIKSFNVVPSAKNKAKTLLIPQVRGLNSWSLCTPLPQPLLWLFVRLSPSIVSKAPVETHQDQD